MDMPPRTRDKIAILGFTPHNYKAPFRDPSWDFAGLNDLHSLLQQHWPEIFTSGQVVWFQIHTKEAHGEYPGQRDPAHTKWLQQQTFPILMQEIDPTVPQAVRYPLEEILSAKLLPTGQPLSPEGYYNNSISWMIAWAILRGYKTIGLFGVDMAMDGVHGESEYGHQRPSVEYFVGVARGLGIEVVMPQESEICKTAYLYGFDNKMHVRQKLVQRHEDLQLAESQAVDAYEQSKRALFQVKGAQQILAGDTGPDLAALRQHIPAEVMQKAMQALANDEVNITNENEAAKRGLHETRGALQNVKWLLRNYFPGEGPFQDLPRTQTSILNPAPSDGHGPVTVGAQNATVQFTLEKPKKFKNRLKAALKERE